MKKKIFTILVLVSIYTAPYCKTLNVGPSQTYSSPALAATAASPGDTILMHSGSYAGPFFISNLNGNANAWIVIMGISKNTVVLNAGSEGLHFSDINYVKIQDMSFTGQTGNGMNIDDAGTIQTPAKHVVVTNCNFTYMGAQGNNDFLKLSGLDSFEVSNCIFFRAASGGSGIDMVGCHYGWIHHCLFDSMGSNSIQMKGGSRFLKIENNRFRNGGQRALNLGGSTGLAFFRPIDATHEAADITVHANVFIKGQAPIAFVGSERVDVSNNTFYMPEKWVIRILQETVDTTRFVPCRNGMFRNNIIYFSSVVTTHVNIGSNTAPNTFLFSHNLWYNSSNPASSTPQLPATEISQITGQDPLFTGVENFVLKAASPAIGNGTSITGLPNDMQGVAFKNPPSRGAYEYNKVSTGPELKSRTFIVYPNPAFTSFSILNLAEKITCKIVNSQGQVLGIQELDVSQNCVLVDALPQGIYQLILTREDGSSTSEILLKL
jgi:hypothetical protein